MIFVKFNYKAAGEKSLVKKENDEAFLVALAREVKHYFAKCSSSHTGVTALVYPRYGTNTADTVSVFLLVRPRGPETAEN